MLSRFSRVLVVKKIHDIDLVSEFCDIVSWLVRSKNMTVYAETNALCAAVKDLGPVVETFCSGKEVDLVVSLGGDGTLMHASSLFPQEMPLTVSFNLGTMGFLTPHSFGDFRNILENVFSGDYTILRRDRLCCRIVSAGIPQESLTAMNDVVAIRTNEKCSRICRVNIYVNDILLTTVEGDGVILSTSTGSTAYAAAAGSSLLHPMVPGVVICPICSHSLSFRPLVVPLDSRIALEAVEHCLVSLDGANVGELLAGQRIVVSRSVNPISCVTFDADSEFYAGLSECLHWNKRGIRS